MSRGEFWVDRERLRRAEAEFAAAQRDYDAEDERSKVRVRAARDERNAAREGRK